MIFLFFLNLLNKTIQRKLRKDLALSEQIIINLSNITTKYSNECLKTECKIKKIMNIYKK